MNDSIESGAVKRSLRKAYDAPESYIKSRDCMQDYLYLVTSRSIGELAVCTGVDEYGCVKFEGWRNKMGRDYLFTEYHWDDSSVAGTVRPHVELELTPLAWSLDWMLQKHIELQTVRIELLSSEPECLAASEALGVTLQDCQDRLSDLHAVRREGFSAHPVPTFREIMNSKNRPDNAL